MDQVANVRIHGTTGCMPVERWRQEGLKRFNLIPFAEVERHPRKVSADSMVSYDACRYSVPHRYVGQIVAVQDQKNGRIAIFAGDQLIADHPKGQTKREMIINRSHFEGLSAAGNTRSPPRCPGWRRATSPKCFSAIWQSTNNFG